MLPGPGPGFVDLVDLVVRHRSERSALAARSAAFTTAMP